MEGIHGAGKGDTYRLLDQDAYARNYEAIFGKKERLQKRTEKPKTNWIVPVEKSVFLDLDTATGEPTQQEKVYIRLPEEVIRKMRLKKDMPIDITVKDGRIIVTRVPHKKQNRRKK
jgi:hypothetical protein